MASVRITEHTTTDDTYCTVENLDDPTAPPVEVGGDMEQVAAAAEARGFTVAERVLS